MWRTVIVSEGEKITVKDGWLNVFCDKIEQHVPLDDIHTLVIDNRSALISVAAMTALTSAGAQVFFCDEKHNPVSAAYPLNTHYRPFGVVKSQLMMSDELKNALWAKIIVQKIRNQWRCLRLAGVNEEKADPVIRLAGQILPGDPQNREGTAAKKYFSALFGPAFSRNDDDVTNAALNYGYAIMRSSLCKTLVAYGFNCVIGLHHISETNPFNLADDMIEPLRPLVDLWTDANCDNLFDHLSKDNRTALINLINAPVLFDGKKMRVRYAIDRYIASLSAAVIKNDARLLKLPSLIALEDTFEDEQDG